MRTTRATPTRMITSQVSLPPLSYLLYREPPAVVEPRCPADGEIPRNPLPDQLQVLPVEVGCRALQALPARLEERGVEIRGVPDRADFRQHVRGHAAQAEEHTRRLGAVEDGGAGSEVEAPGEVVGVVLETHRSLLRVVRLRHREELVVTGHNL